jgi:hypothetical protein
MLGALSLAAGLAWASGLRLYLAVLLVGLFARVGIAHLPEQLAILASPWIIGAAALLAIVEFLADKIPTFDSLWDALHTLIRIPAGAVLAGAAMGPADPQVVALAALAGGAIAGAAHLAKSGMRAMINFSRTPVPNGVASLVEDALAFAGLSLALFAPAVFLVALLAFLVGLTWVLPWLWRGVRDGFRAMAVDMIAPGRGIGRLQGGID